jgi:hypothetical protein
MTVDDELIREMERKIIRKHNKIIKKKICYGLRKLFRISIIRNKLFIRK